MSTSSLTTPPAPGDRFGGGWAPHAGAAGAAAGSPPWYQRRRAALAGGGLAIVAIAAVASAALLVRPAPGDNGEGDKTGNQIYADARSSLTGASSVHITATAITTTETDVLDIHAGPDSGSGTVVTSGVQADVIVIGNAGYIRGRAFFAKFAGPAAAAVIGDRWLKVSADDPHYQNELHIFAIRQMQQHIFTPPDGRLSRGQTTTVDGVHAIRIDGRASSMDIALDGPPYPMRWHITKDGNTTDAAFHQWNAAIAPVAAPTDVLDLGPGATS